MADSDEPPSSAPTGDNADNADKEPSDGAVPASEHGVYAAPAPLEQGGRVELRLLSVEEEGTEALYGARWFTADQQLEGRVSILMSDRPEVTLTAPDNLPEWLGAFTTTLVRTTARSAVTDQVWPRRLTRWRKAPDDTNEK